MNAERLLHNLDRLIDTTDAVPSLRWFILNLAVLGKFVPQNPKDEPEGMLLNRIRKEKDQNDLEHKMSIKEKA
ncbi:MAG: hypothetical protein IT393_01665 [Nitrospirae bacterium]|nr:hypothetical protein [Nitrospirota bacterium]